MLHDDDQNTLEIFQEIINETSTYLSKEYYAQFASKLGIVTLTKKING